MKKFLIAFLIFSVSIIYFSFFYNYGINLLDEGYLLDPVTRVLNGDIPHRDFYHQYVAARFYLFALLFKLFKPDIIITRIVFMILLAFSSVLLFLITSKFTSSGFSLIPSLFILAAPGPWQKSFFVFFSILNLYILLRIIEKNDYSKSYILGVINALTILFRQDVGVYSSITAVIIMIYACIPLTRDEFRNFAWIKKLFKITLKYFLSFSAVLLPVFTFFYLHSALDDFLSQSLFAGLDGAKQNSLAFPSLFPLLPKNLEDIVIIPTRLSAYVPILIYIITAFIILKNIRALKVKNCQEVLLLCTLLLGTQIYRLNLHRTHVLHLFQVAPISYVLGAMLLSRINEGLKRTGDYLLQKFYLLGVACIILLTVLLLLKMDHFHYPNSIMVRFQQNAPFTHGGSTLYIAEEKAKTLNSLLEFIEKNTVPGEFIFACPDIPIIYFLSKRPNPTEYELLRPGFFRTREDQAQVIQDIQEKNVRYVIYNTEHIDDDKPERRFESHASVIFRYLLENFDPVEKFGNFQVLKRIKKPSPGSNIILITIDSLRADHLGLFGYDLLTSPALDSLAANSIVFSRAFTHCPKTMPSLTSLFTSKLPVESGVRFNFQKIPYDLQVFTELLTKNSYVTAAFVSSPLLSRGAGFERHFDHYDDTLTREAYPKGFRERNAAETVDAASGWLGQNSMMPFFLWIHFMDPHGPYTPPQQFVSPIHVEEPETVPLSEIPRYQLLEHNLEKRFYVSRYDGEIRFVDSQIQRLFHTLRVLNLWENSIVIVTSDHGESMGEHGYYFEHGRNIYDEQIKVPLIIKLTSSDQLKGTISEPVRMIDIAPTVLSLVNAPELENASGRDLFPLIKGLARQESYPVILESDDSSYGSSQVTEKKLGIRMGEWKYVLNPGSDAELYHIKADPCELNNLLKSGSVIEYSSITMKAAKSLRENFGKSQEEK